MQEFINFLQSAPAHELVIAASLGALIGLERELAGKDPSLRTFSLICLGSCLFSIVSVDAAAGIVHADPSRIAAQIVSGIGFLGAGVIFRSSRGVTGFTTAALMWATAAIGMAVGFGRIDLAATATILALLINYVLQLVHRIIRLIRGPKTIPPPEG